jgi:hypothetical protein
MQINAFLSFVKGQRLKHGHAFGNMVNINSATVRISLCTIDGSATLGGDSGARDVRPGLRNRFNRLKFAPLRPNDGRPANMSASDTFAL